ncbi:MAG: amidase, partial [Clostridia bacterium]|nr:amidase [Clostridia bacterium]
SAAAVADGLVPIAEGGDAGGSIRIPAAWCNLVGFKASVGTVPSVVRPDAWSATHPYCCNGGLTKTVEDAAILLNFMARFDPRDPLSRDLGPKDFTELMGRSVKGWRVAWTPDFGIFPVDPEVAKRTEQTALLLKEAGAIVEPVEFRLPRTAGEYGEIWCRSISVDTAIELELDRRNGFDLIKEHRDELPEEFIYWNEQAARGGILDYYEFNRARTELLDAQQDVFDRYDILLSPTSTCLPVRNADDRNTKGPTEVNGTPVDPLIGFAETFLFNFTGNPAASVPAGFSQSGLPVGLQVIGKRFRDEDVLTVARTLEQLRS